MADHPPAVRVTGLWKRYAGREALREVSLEVPQGSCLSIFGPNGSGKTTLLRILATLSLPSEGRVEVAGQVLPAGAQAARARIGVVLDDHLLPRDLRLSEALRFYAELYGVPRPMDRIEELAGRVGLAWRLRDPVRTFSRGMAQRAGLVRAFLHDPEVLLLDEPFNGLDLAACRVLEDMIAEAKGRGRTVLLVTHDVERGLAAADRAAVMDRGRLVYLGLAAEAGEAIRATSERTKAGGA